MAFASGQHVKIKPLNKRGRVIGSQNTGQVGVVLYLVRYEIEDRLLLTRHSESSLYFSDELAPTASVDDLTVEDGQHLAGDDGGVDPQNVVG
jgi:hypothetical protein